MFLAFFKSDSLLLPGIVDDGSIVSEIPVL